MSAAFNLPAFPSRRDAEDYLFGRVRAAKFCFDLALAQAETAGLDPAIVEKARLQYLQELEIFTDIVVRGIIPGE